MLAEAWERRTELGWTDDVCADLARQCLAILERPEWPEKVRVAYASADAGERNLAWQLYRLWRLREGWPTRCR